MATGSLIIVGTGIQAMGQLTLAAITAIRQADKVLFAVADRLAAAWLRTLNPTAEALPRNTNHHRRREMHREMVERILIEVRQRREVCAVFYGHPGVFSDPAHQAINQARSEGFKATMLPGISAQDCLFADLGVDPGCNGCQSFEATDFLIRRRKFDPMSTLILWQVAMIGNLGFHSFHNKAKAEQGLIILTEVLEQYYDPDHEVVIYEAAVDPTGQPIIHHLTLAGLPTAQISQFSTLYVPAKSLAPIDQEMMVRLGISL